MVSCKAPLLCVSPNQAGSSRFNHANEVSVAGFSQANQPSLGGFSNAIQTSMGGFGQANQDSVGSFDQFSVQETFGQDKRQTSIIGGIDLPNEVSSGGFTHANQALVAGYNKSNHAILLMEERSGAEFGDIQMQAHHRSCGKSTDMERLKEELGAAGADSDILLAADGFYGEMQASILAQGDSNLQRFLPSNEDEELELGGALFGCDEFRMYEFKVRFV